MPEICRFFGIVIRMFFADHDPPHILAEHQGDKAVFDLRGNIIHGDIKSRTAIKLVREWISLHIDELSEDWNLARAGQAINKIPPLD